MASVSPNIHEENTPLILFDGLCGFCSASVQWLIKHDKKAVLRFAPIQSKIGRAIYRKQGLDPENIQTFLLIAEDKPYVKSEAALKIVKIRGGFWWILTLFYLLPRPIRDFFYDRLATCRLRLMGRRQSCMTPSESTKKRFLE